MLNKIKSLIQKKEPVFKSSISELKIKTMSDVVLARKIVLLRTDFNVPIINNKIIDDFKITSTYKTILRLMDQECKVVIISHHSSKKQSLSPAHKRLSDFIGKHEFVSSTNIDNIQKAILKTKYGKCIFLENIRMHPGEEQNQVEFAQQIASFGNIYMNDAFSCMHRKHSSIDLLPKLMPGTIGPHASEELIALQELKSSQKKKKTCILGGGKVSTKAECLKFFASNYDTIILGGGIANTFLKYKNYDIGRSYYDSDSMDIASEVFQAAKSSNCSVIIPETYTVAESLDEKDISQARRFSIVKQKMKSTDMILDVSPDEIEENIKICNSILKSDMIFMNGPFGLYEFHGLQHGTIKLFDLINRATKNNGCLSVLSGGDTMACIKKYDHRIKPSLFSTGGGATMAFLSKKSIPGIDALQYSSQNMFFH